MNWLLLTYVCGAIAVLALAGVVLIPWLEKLSQDMHDRERSLREEKLARGVLKRTGNSGGPPQGETAGVDLHVEKLITRRQYAEARELCRQRLRESHEQGKRDSEERYRRYLKQLDAILDG